LTGEAAAGGVAASVGLTGGAAAFATGAAAGAAGSIASQEFGNLIGAHQGFSWTDVAMSGLTAGFGASIGPATSGLSGFDKAAAIAGRAAIANTLTQGVAIAAGTQNSFNWRNVAASAVGAGVGAQATNMLGSSFGDLGQFGGNVARGTISGFAAGLTSSVMRGGKIELTQVATDAFGNALGSSVASMGLSGSATSNRGDSITGLNSDISTYYGTTAQGVLDSLGQLSIPHDGYIGSSTYGLGELHAAGLNVPQASRFFMSLDEGGSAPRMGDTGPMNEEIDPTIPAVTITGHRMSFFEKIGSYFGDASDAIKDVFSTQDFSQKSDYQMAQYPFSNFAANTEIVNRAAARGQLPYTMGGVLSDVTKLGIKGGAAMAAFPYAASMVGRMGASQGYSILGASILTDAGLQTVNNLDGSQRGWSPIQSAVSVGLPLAALGAKPAAIWLASGLENGVNVGGFKILDPSGARMYDIPPGGANSAGLVESEASALQRIAANNRVDTGSAARMARIDELAGANYQRRLGEAIDNQEYVYRYLSEKGLSDSTRYGTLRGYTTTTSSMSSAEVANGVQILPEWGIPQYGVKIPVSELNGFSVARPMGGKSTLGWEPFANSYPAAGSGGWPQFLLNEVPFNPANVFKLKP